MKDITGLGKDHNIPVFEVQHDNYSKISFDIKSAFSLFL